MAIDDTLDFTPYFTMSTLQTPSNIANIIINSLLLVFILSYINIAVGKLVYFTRSDTFSYRAWLRAYIFTNSDDLLRIISWLLGRYTLKESHWQTHPNKLRWKRLLLPMLARAFIFIASLISIAATIEGDRVLDGCQKGDYALRFNEQNANLNRVRRTRPICTTIPLKSNLGEPNTTAAYCSCVTPSDIGEDLPTSGGVGIYITTLPRKEELVIGLLQEGKLLFEASYVEWKPGNSTGMTFRSRLSTAFEFQQFSDSIQRWFETDNTLCQDPKISDFSDETTRGLIYLCSPSLSPEDIMNRLQSRIMTSLTWEHIDAVQERVSVDTFLNETSDSLYSPTTECMVPVIVTRPIVNMAPLCLFLAGLVIINVIISAFVSRHDNALDAGFHVVKEALGHDSTSNPLEKCEDREELMDLEFKKWRCGGGGYHAGYQRRLGDMEVKDFDSSMIVCGCAIVQVENERAQALHTAPVAFSAPDSSLVKPSV